MKAVIIIESWFGNTAAIGQEIARELQTRGTLVNMVGVAEAPTTLPADTDLLLVGAPTHNRGLSTPSTREKASVTAKVAGDHSIGVREWLASATLPDGVKVAAFDTVTGKNFISGSAAKAASKILGRRSPGSMLRRDHSWCAGPPGRWLMAHSPRLVNGAGSWPQQETDALATTCARTLTIAT